MDAETQKAQDVEYHREVATIYDAAVTRQFRVYHEMRLFPWLERLTREKPSAILLDVGTGTGVVALAAAQRGLKVYALDHSPDMLAQAQHKAEQLGLSDRITFQQGDGEALPCPDGSFDAVTIQGVLHHLPDSRPMLRETYRVLKTGGQVYISEPCRESTLITRAIRVLLLPPRLLKRALRGGSNIREASDHEEPISGEELVQLAEEAGFDVRADYLVMDNLSRHLPDSLRRLAITLLSLPTRRRHGDLVFLFGTKR